MTGATDTAGPVALLGGDGLRSQSRDLWRALAALGAHGWEQAVIVPAALAGQRVGTAERRARLAQEALADAGIRARVAPIVSAGAANSEELLDDLRRADALYFPGGEARAMVAALAGSAAWEAVRERHRSGALLVAGGGAAVALGELAFAPQQPAPAAMEELRFERYEGLGLLHSLVVLPYFNWLQAPLLERIEALCPAGSWLAGIDDQAALIRVGSTWHADGPGSVTLWRAGERRQTIQAGREAPPGWQPPAPETR